MRRYRDLYLGLLNDIGGESASEAQKLLARRGAALAVELETREATFATAGADDSQLQTYQRVANSLRRVVEMLNVSAPVGHEDNLVERY